MKISHISISLFICLCINVLFGFNPVFADKVYLKSGKVFEVKSYWEEGDSVCFEMYGATLKVHRDKIDRIETTEIDESLSDENTYDKSNDVLCRNLKARPNYRKIGYYFPNKNKSYKFGSGIIYLNMCGGASFKAKLELVYPGYTTEQLEKTKVIISASNSGNSDDFKVIKKLKLQLDPIYIDSGKFWSNYGKCRKVNTGKDSSIISIVCPHLKFESNVTCRLTVIAVR